MKKFFISCFATAAASLTLQAETVTIHHEIEGGFATELANCGTAYASITELIIEGEAYMNKADMMEIKSRLQNYLVKLDLSGASFEKNAIPDGASGTRGALSEMKKLKECVLPETLMHLGKATFAVCSVLEKVNIPEEVKTLDQFVFANCPKLHDITLPEGLERIYKNVFQKCTSLPFTELPQNLRSISLSAFQDSNVAFTSLPESVEEIAALCFANTKVSFTKLPEGIKYDFANKENAPGGIFHNTKTLIDFEIPVCFWEKLPARMFYVANDAVKRTFTCRSMTPPDATAIYSSSPSQGVFSDITLESLPNTTVKVPYKAMDAYKATAPWSGMNVEYITVPVDLTVEHAHTQTVEPGHVTVSFIVEDVEHTDLNKEVMEGEGKMVISFSSEAHEALYVKEVRRNVGGVSTLSDEGEEEPIEEDEVPDGWESIYTCQDPANAKKQTVEIPMTIDANMGAHQVIIAAHADPTSIEEVATPATFKRIGNIIELSVEGAELYDAAGRVVAATDGNEISLTGLAKGIYILKTHETTTKIVK